MQTILPNQNPKKTLFQNLTYDNFFLNTRCNELMTLVHNLQTNVHQLNGFIRSNYDLSYNVLENIKIIAFDSSDNIISCIRSDTSGNFLKCDDLSMNYLPCVINPMINTHIIQPSRKISKTHITDISRGYPFDYPYYPYYPYYPRYPYGPYYHGLIDDNYLYRDIDVNKPSQPGQPILPHPIMPPIVNGQDQGMHIHIHPPSK
jgi:hypothetical protein